jgi:membrane protease YdiL (CAAX protease family)
MRLAPLLLVVAAVTLVGVGTYFGFQPERSGTPAFWGVVAAPTILLAAIALYRAHRDGVLADSLRPKWGDFSRAFLAAAGLYVAAYGFSRSVAAAGTPREIWVVSLYGQLGDPRALQSHALLVGLAILAIAAAEEIVWRGMVTQLLAEKLGSRRAWIGSALLYALAQAPTMWALRSGSGLDPILPLAALAAGLVFGAMERAFGRLVPSILAHALFDWGVVMMFPLWGLSRLA